LKILYFYQYFSTSNGSWGTRVHEFTREWVKEGHEVIVVSSIYSKSDLTAIKFIEDQDFDGVKVKVVNVRVDNKQPIYKRIYTFLAYALVSCWYALTVKADVVIASSGPITVGLPGLVAKYLRRRKLVFEVRDLWPDGAIELGLLNNKVLQKLAYWFERKCYNAADLIVTLSPGMQHEIIEKHQHKNVISVTNSANIELFATLQEFPADISSFKKRKYALYTGNIGMVNNVEWMFEAAKILGHLGRNDIQIVWIGDGQLKQKFAERKELEGIDNLILMDLMPKNKLVPIVQNSLVCLAPLKDTKVLNTSSPNKFFESLAAGVPVIQTTNGWMKVFVEEHEVGFTVDPNDAQALADKLIALADNPDQLVKMGLNAAKIAKQEFDKTILAEKMLRAIENI
jgi:glycosyltransferase involved in cell wall biosynthesis